MFKLRPNTALIMVDMQRDFCSGGALAVNEGGQVIPALNRYAALFKKKGLPIYVTRDWHPKNHISFKKQGGPWPPHCIQESRGAEFHPELKLPSPTVVISKGTSSGADAYSGFEGTNLALHLKQKGIKELLIGGLATDYCVKNTVLDACRLGFVTYLLTDAIRGVEVERGDSEKAIKEMEKGGAIPLTFEEII